MLRFGYENVNLFTSAIEVYQVTFSIFEFIRLRFICKGCIPYVLSPLSILFKNYTLQINTTQPHRQINRYTMFLVWFQFTIFSHMNTRDLFANDASFVSHQRNYADLHSFIWTYC